MRTMLRSPLVLFILIALIFIVASWSTEAGASRDPSPPEPLRLVSINQAVPDPVPAQDICLSGTGPRIVESNDGGPYVESPRAWTCVTLADGSHALQSTP